MPAPLLFVGDSITDAGRRDDPRRLGNGYVRLIADELAARGDERPLVNSGVGGDRAKDLRARWSADVLAHEPRVLTVYVGINDTWRRYAGDDPTSAEEFEGHYRAMLDQVVAPCDLILIEPFVTPIDDGQRTWHEDLDPKRAVVRDLAAEYGAEFVPLHAIFQRAAEPLAPGALAWDGVHPTPEGDRLIANSWLDAFDRLEDGGRER